MDSVSWLGVLLGLESLALILIAILRGEFSNLEAPKYEMLGLEPPTSPAPRVIGRIGIEDRVIRLGLVGAAFYYASRVGWDSLIGIGLAGLGTYLLMTGLWGRDPIYILLKLDTRMRDQ